MSPWKSHLVTFYFTWRWPRKENQIAIEDGDKPIVRKSTYKVYAIKSSVGFNVYTPILDIVTVEINF